MSIQHFWTAPSAIAFPMGMLPGSVETSLPQLHKLFYHSPSDRLLGIWAHTATEQPMRGWVAIYWRSGYIGRDGTNTDLYTIPIGLIARETAFCQTTDGNIIRGADNSINVANGEMSNAVTDGMYYVSQRWGMDMLTNTRVASVAVVSSSPHAAIVFAGGTAWTISQLSTNLHVVARPTNTTLFQEVGATWANAHDFMFIDFKTVAVTFMQNSAGTNVDGTLPASIRVFDTTTTPWTLKWIDRLPGTDNRACYDQVNQVLYSCNRNSGAVLNASRLRQMPVSISTPTLGTDSVLRERTATLLSVLVTNELNCAISGATVKWNLVGATSGGGLTSSYSLTDDNGAAKITYIGPQLAGSATKTETISAEVAEIWPKGLI